MPYIDVNGQQGRLDTFKRLLREKGQEGEHQSIENALVEYLDESEHAGWDGFSARDLYAIRKFIIDFGVYVANR